MFDRNSASVPTSAKSCWHAVMIALRESFGLRCESMKSTFTLRPAIPPVALMYLAAPFTASTADWNRPGANGLSTSATTAMRIWVGVTPTSVALLASLCAPALTVPTVASPAEMTSAHAQTATLSRFTGPPWSSHRVSRVVSRETYHTATRCRQQPRLRCRKPSPRVRLACAAMSKAGKATPENEVGAPKVLTKAQYEKELARLQTELVRMQEWIIHEHQQVLVIFEGRDTAGKGGTIKRIIERLNARNYRVVALGTPTERERSQWYFQRYIPHLPAGGEIVFFDRSWYNRAGVERVMGFCTEDEHTEFFRTCPQLERALVRSGMIVVKYWLSLSDEEQERRFTERINNPGKRWKLSPMDLGARARWVDYA